MPANSEDIRFEQRYVTKLYNRLDELRVHTRERLAHVRRTGPSGSPQNRSERDAFATLYEDRLQQLENVEDRLVFGRLDLIDSDRRYVGRIGVQDGEHQQLLTDWRAPAAEPFYQATAAHPQGVVLRRHLTTRGRKVTAIEDDVLDLENLSDSARANLAGEGALLAALTASRTGRMSDIVATIQAEQDRIIRAPLAGALVVQGGPGTGKTAVALHRVAYLLYAHRRRLESSGVLVIGPSSEFLRYIENVLPSLGETGVIATTIADLLPHVRATATEDDAVAEIKGRALMSHIIRRAVRQRQRVPEAVQTLQVERAKLRLVPAEVSEGIDRARRTRKPHNDARVVFVQHMLGKLAEQYARALEFEPTIDDLQDLAEELRHSRDVRVALNLCWMPVTAEKVVETLWSNPTRLAAAAPSLSAREREMLSRPAGEPWTVADIPLLDEAAELVGDDDQARRAQEQQERRRREQEVAYAEQVLAATGVSAMVSAELLADRFGHNAARATAAEAAAHDRTWTFGHVVVDEARELSPMAWRALLRRCPTRSFTIVGDTSQASAAAGTRNWRERLDPLFGEHLRIEELTVNYRTPSHIMEPATAAGRAAGLQIADAITARTGDYPVQYVAARGSLPEAVAEVVAAQLHIAGEGRLAVIAPQDKTLQLWTALAADEKLAPLLATTGLNASPARDLEAPVTVLTPEQAKGLEFDVVVLAEPGEIAAQPVRGPGDLYVAMSRSTQALAIVHAGDLPPGLP